MPQIAIEPASGARRRGSSAAWWSCPRRSGRAARRAPPRDHDVDPVDRARAAVVLYEAARLQHQFGGHAEQRNLFRVTEPTIIAVDWSGAKKTGLKSGIWRRRHSGWRLVRSEAGRRRGRRPSRSYKPASRPYSSASTSRSRYPRGSPANKVARPSPTCGTSRSADGETWLRPTPPFWRDRCVLPVEQRFRRCELELRPAKSIFQLVGNGQVGAGSVRGMPLLARLRANGFAIWPFDAPGDRTVVEIYPSRLRRMLHARRDSLLHDRARTRRGGICARHVGTPRVVRDAHRRHRSRHPRSRATSGEDPRR